MIYVLAQAFRLYFLQMLIWRMHVQTDRHTHTRTRMRTGTQVKKTNVVDVLQMSAAHIYMLIGVSIWTGGLTVGMSSLAAGLAIGTSPSSVYLESTGFRG